MPIATNPKARFEIVLENDKGRPAAEQAVFVYRHLTMAEEAELMRLYMSINAADDKAATDATFAAVRFGLLECRNLIDLEGQPVKGKPEAAVFQNILCTSEVMELITKIMNEIHLPESVKKKSDSPSASSTGRSARTARALKNARTRRTKRAQSKTTAGSAAVEGATAAAGPG